MDRRHGDLGKTSKEDSSGPKRKDKIYTYEEGGFPHTLVSLDIASRCAQLSQMCSTPWESMLATGRGPASFK